MNIDCVIFDLDGVLVDSITAWIEAYKKTCRKFGLYLTRLEKPNMTMWATDRELIDRFLPKHLENREDKIKQMERYLYDTMERFVASSYIKPQKGARELLEALRQRNKKLAIVTNNDRRLVNKILRQFELSKFFDVTVTKDDVKMVKPHPDPILKAAKKLGCKPNAILYIGASEIDIIAGKAAGVMTAMFKPLTRKESFEPRTTPDYVLNKLEEILPLLEK